MLDTLGIEPRASRMLSGCDTTTPRAHEQLGWVRNHSDHKRGADPDVRDAYATLSRRGGAPAEPPPAACRPAAAEHTEVARWTSPGTAHNQDGQPADAGSAGLPTARHIGVASPCRQWHGQLDHMGRSFGDRARHPYTNCLTGLKRQAGARHSAMTSDPATRNRTRDHLITAKCLQSDALPTEL